MVDDLANKPINVIIDRQNMVFLAGFAPVDQVDIKPVLKEELDHAPVGLKVQNVRPVY